MSTSTLEPACKVSVLSKESNALVALVAWVLRGIVSTTAFLCSLVALHRQIPSQDDDDDVKGGLGGGGEALHSSPLDSPRSFYAIHHCFYFACMPFSGRHPFSKACLQQSQTVIQPCMWFLHDGTG